MFDCSSIFPFKYQNHFTNNSMKELDINVDIGEGFNIEAEIMPLIQSCNIACGGHAGNNKEMSKLISLARQNNVKIGVHPSYPDKDNFGRISMNIDNKKLKYSEAVFNPHKVMKINCCFYVSSLLMLTRLKVIQTLALITFTLTCYKH